MFKVNNADTERQQQRRSGIFIVIFKQISHFVLVFPVSSWVVTVSLLLIWTSFGMHNVEIMKLALHM